MSAIFIVIGLTIAGYAGYKDLAWYFIFTASAFMAIGYFIARAPQIKTIIAEDGAGGGIKLFLIQAVFYTIIAAPVFFLANFVR